jgi:hypothetical protein
MYLDEQARELIDEMLRNGVTSSSKISRVIERDNGIEVPPHTIAEYKYRKRRNQEIMEDFSDFDKGKPEGTKTAP